MSKENSLFAIIGLLAGMIIGFLFTNSINQRGGLQTQTASQNPVLTSPTAADSPLASPGGTAAQAEMNMAEVQAAIDQARNEPNNFEAQTKAAQLYYQIRRFDQTLQFLEQANKLRPDTYEVIVQLGNANFDAGRYEQAEEWYTAALRKKPTDVNVRTDLGLTFFFRQPPDIDRAVAEYRRSLEQDPRHELTLQNLTAALNATGNAEEARMALARLEAVNPNNPAIPKLRSDLAQLRSSPNAQASSSSN